LLRETEQLKKGKSTFWTMNDIFLQIWKHKSEMISDICDAEV
jgi:hypothetical protein